jgi:hypothetical protein
MLCPLLGEAGTLSWKRLKIAEHPVSVELPGAPKVDHHTSTWGPFGTTETDALEAAAAGGTFSATATVAPSWAIKGAGRDLIFVTTRDKILRKHKGKVESWTKIQRAGLDGKRMTYKVRDAERVGVMEVFVRDPFILAFDAVFPAGTEDATVDRFFGSIRMFDAP